MVKKKFNLKIGPSGSEQPCACTCDVNLDSGKDTGSTSGIAEIVDYSSKLGTEITPGERKEYIPTDCSCLCEIGKKIAFTGLKMDEKNKIIYSIAVVVSLIIVFMKGYKWQAYDVGVLKDTYGGSKVYYYADGLLRTILFSQIFLAGTLLFVIFYLFKINIKIPLIITVLLAVSSITMIISSAIVFIYSIFHMFLTIPGPGSTDKEKLKYKSNWYKLFYSLFVLLFMIGLFVKTRSDLVNSNQFGSNTDMGFGLNEVSLLSMNSFFINFILSFNKIITASPPAVQGKYESGAIGWIVGKFSEWFSLAPIPGDTTKEFPGAPKRKGFALINILIYATIYMLIKYQALLVTAPYFSWIFATILGIIFYIINKDKFDIGLGARIKAAALHLREATLADDKLKGLKARFKKNQKNQTEQK